MPNTSLDDDDLGSLFRARREASQAKRASNREYSTQLLRDSGVQFTEHNGGAHLVIGNWNLWPGTGRWSERKGRAGFPLREGRGVQRLLEIIRKDAL